MISSSWLCKSIQEDYREAHGNCVDHIQGRVGKDLVVNRSEANIHYRHVFDFNNLTTYRTYRPADFLRRPGFTHGGLNQLWEPTTYNEPLNVDILHAWAAH